jgi:hypothetical protein
MSVTSYADDLGSAVHYALETTHAIADRDGSNRHWSQVSIQNSAHEEIAPARANEVITRGCPEVPILADRRLRRYVLWPYKMR